MSPKGKTEKEPSEPRLRITLVMSLKRWEWFKNQKATGKKMAELTEDALNKVYPLK